MRNINANQSGCDVRAATSIGKFELESLVFLMDFEPPYKKNLGPMLVNAPIILIHVG